VFPFTEFEDTGDDDKDEEEEEADKENQVIAELEELVNQFNTTKL
jgi:hypothetical protein